MNKFWKWKNLEAAESQPAQRVLELNGTIAAESWFDDDVTPAVFKDELMSGTGPVTVWINSPGGDTIAASQIYSMLVDYRKTADVTVMVDGIAASAASVIAMAGTKVVMAPTALMMIHNPSTIAEGDHNDLSKAIELLAEVKESIINAYEMKTGMSHSKIDRMMEDETWMNAKKAIELKFADEIMKPEEKQPMEEDVAFAYSDHQVSMALMNKISSKMKMPEGRKVADLRNKLDTIKEFI